MKRSILLGMTALSLAGCITTQQHELDLQIPPAQMSAYLADKTPEVRPLYSRVLIEGKRNESLNFMRAGLASMEFGDYDNAAKSFDNVLNTIETVYVDDPKAAEARSLWTKENVKDFKGEPYERAMAYYYRGLLYMLANDLENARASFKGGIVQSTLSYGEKYDSDFAFLDYMQGWAARCAGAGATARDSFEIAGKRNAALVDPGENNNVLILSELGAPPMKVAQGKQSELLTFAAGNAGSVRSVVVTTSAAGTPPDPRWQPRDFPGYQAVDLYQLASSRNGRAIDGILAGKAQFKETTQTASAVAMGVGVGLMASGNSNARDAGAVIALVGLIGTIAAEAMRPEADVRTWDNIPGSIDLATLRASDLIVKAPPPPPPAPVVRGRPPAQSQPVAVPHNDMPLTLSARLIGADGNEIARRPLELHATGNRCMLGWVRTRPTLQQAPSAPDVVAVNK